MAFAALMFTISGFAQGIEFEHGSWAEVLSKSKATNKPIFVDIYTSWCGPCKQMSKNIFPQKEVGDKYNHSFICYKIDAEKGEGVELAKTYNVSSYPTFLFIKPDGSLFYKITGSRAAYEFIAEADIALQKAGIGKIEKTLDEYKQEYDKGNRDPDFLVAYMKQRYIDKQSNVELADTLFKYLPTDKRLAAPYVELLVSNAVNFFSPLYTFLANNFITVRDAIDPSMRDVFKARMRTVADRTVSSYKGKPNSAIPEKVTSVYIGAFDGLKVSKDEPLYLTLSTYYANALDTVGYLNNATKYAGEVLLRQTKERLNDSTRKTQEDALDQLNAGEIDSAAYQYNLARSEAFLSLSAFRSANLAAGIATRAQTKEQQQLALKLAEHSISLEETPNNMSAYALVLSRTGKQKEAKKIVQKALDDATAKNDRNLPAIKERYEGVVNAK